jgi:hypothetical protein
VPIAGIGGLLVAGDFDLWRDHLRVVGFEFAMKKFQHFLILPTASYLGPMRLRIDAETPSMRMFVGGGGGREGQQMRQAVM